MAARNRFFALALVGRARRAAGLGRRLHDHAPERHYASRPATSREDASWDAEKLVFLDEFGNQISLAKSDVETIRPSSRTAASATC